MAVILLRAAPFAALIALSGVASAEPPRSNAFISERRADQWLASSLKARNVYDRSDVKIGVINDLVVDRDGRVAAFVIGVGGFLGIGEKNVAVPFEDVKITLHDSRERLVLDRSRDDLKAAPAFGPASATSLEVGSGSDRNYGTLNAPHGKDEAPPP